MPSDSPGGAAPKAQLGTSYVGYQPLLMDRLLPLIDALEITPDILRVDSADAGQLDADALAQLRECAAEAAILVHGIGLSIGSADGWNESYFQTLDTLFNAVPVQWHSEHLGYTTVDGQFMGTMLPLPRTQEALDLLSDRCERIGARYGVPFLLENVAPLLPDRRRNSARRHFSMSCVAMVTMSYCSICITSNARLTTMGSTWPRLWTKSGWAMFVKFTSLAVSNARGCGRMCIQGPLATAPSNV